jgi:hypothetical protein
VIAEPPQKKKPGTATVQEKPKKARTPRPKKAPEAVPEVKEAVAAEPFATADAAPKKPRLAAARKMAKPAPVETEVPAEPQPAAQKPAPRPRRPKKVVEVP